jgi:hypothetical protein
VGWSKEVRAVSERSVTIRDAERLDLPRSYDVTPETLAIIESVLEGRYGNSGREGLYWVDVLSKPTPDSSTDRSCCEEGASPDFEGDLPTFEEMRGILKENPICPTCGGTGQYNLGGPVVDIWVECPSCHGTGVAPLGEG